MQSVKDILNNSNYDDLQKLFASARGKSNIDRETEKRTKDIGGFVIPNAFQVPNEIIDSGFLRELTGAELKVLLYLIRKTFGYNKITGDRIPLSQIMDGTKKKDGTVVDMGTGLSRRACIDALATLEKVGLIKIVREQSEDGTKQVNFYQLATRKDYTR